MKRALFVSAGTAAGIFVSMSYTPGMEAMIDGDIAATAGQRPTRVVKVSDREGRSERRLDRSGAERDGSKGGPSGGDSASGGGSRRSRAATDEPDRPSPSTAASNQQPAKDSGAPSNPPSGPKPTQTSKPKPSPKPTPTTTPKSYTGAVATTPFGPVQVSITVVGGRISDASAVQYPKADPKSVALANKALPKLRSETLAAQSADIATVSGASYTSTGWITSLQSALDKAGL